MSLPNWLNPKNWFRKTRDWVGLRFPHPTPNPLEWGFTGVIINCGKCAEYYSVYARFPGILSPEQKNIVRHQITLQTNEEHPKHSAEIRGKV